MGREQRFERIAHDLEKLPCELHGAVLVELDFEQLIRLVKCAGPRLLWSFENSLCSWGKFFRNGYATNGEWLKLLAITDTVKHFVPINPPEPKPKGVRYNVFPHSAMLFLHIHESGWNAEKRPQPFRSLYPVKKNNTELADISIDTLSDHWLKELHRTVDSGTWSVLHEQYDIMIEPWIPRLEQAHGTESTAILTTHAGSNPGIIHRPLSVDEMKIFIEMYQALRVMRAESLATELNRLADLYDARPTVLKMPFAPQTPPRQNLKHVPRRMRWDAVELVRKANTSHWMSKPHCRFGFGYPFPTIVPYDWCILLFHNVFHTQKLSDQKIVDKCKFLLQKPPKWVKWVPSSAGPDDDTSVLPARASKDTTFSTSIQETSRTLESLKLDEQTPKFLIEKPETVYKSENVQQPHNPEELLWLETFAEVVAWMEKEFPALAKKTRAAG